VGHRLAWQGRSHHRDFVRAYLARACSKVTLSPVALACSQLRSIPRYRPHHDGAIQQVCETARETTWRHDFGSINYIETSTWARQEHNGFSHQNPSFIGSVLNLKSTVARVYLPPDANCFLSTLAHCLRAKNYVNLMVGSKHPSRSGCRLKRLIASATF